MASRPCRNSERLRQRLSVVYASATRAGSRVFHASSAIRAFCAAVSAVKGGSGGRLIERSSFGSFREAAPATRQALPAGAITGASPSAPAYLRGQGGKCGLYSRDAPVAREALHN